MPGYLAFDTDITDKPRCSIFRNNGVICIDLNPNPTRGEDWSYSARRALMALVCSSKPGFSRRANMFFL